MNIRQLVAKNDIKKLNTKFPYVHHFKFKKPIINLRPETERRTDGVICIKNL